MDLIIKRADEHEIPLIYEITQEAFTKYSNELGMRHVVSALDETYEDIRTDIVENTVLIAYLEDEAMGSIRYEMLSENIAYITRFGVKAEAQNCGVGRALIGEVEAQAMEIGANMLALHTSSKALPLIRFYYGLGFYIHSTTTDRGYIRALLCKELTDCSEVIAAVVNIK